MKPRTRARSVALQVLYEVDVVDHAPGKVLKERLEAEGVDDILAEFSQAIVTGVLPMVAQLDEFIAEHAQNGPWIRLRLSIATSCGLHFGNLLFMERPL